MRLLLIIVLFLSYSSFSNAQVPFIDSLSQTVGLPGDQLTVYGENFHSHIDSNTVRFGPVKGNVISASITEIVVEVPFGSHFGRVTVVCNGRTAWSAQDFLPTYSGPNTIEVPSFGGNILLDAGSGWVRDPRVADIDGDGKNEIIACGTGGASGDAIRVWQNVDGDNDLDISTWSTGVDFSLVSTPRSMGVGDIDGDGKPDVVVVNNNGTNVAIFHNTSTLGTIDNSSFDAPVYFACSGSPQDLELADIDGDGMLDVILGNHYFDGLITVYRNTSTSGVIDVNSLAPQVHFEAGDYLYNITVGDINGDGKVDISAAAWASDSIYVFVNNATSGIIDNNSFLPSLGFPCAQNPQSIYAGDFNSDGKMDLVTCHNDNNFIRVFENTRTSTVLDANSFGNTFALGTGGQPYELFTIDMTGDNKPEILVSNRTGGFLGVYQNIHNSGALSPSSFASDVRFSIGSNCQGMFAADINGDNKPEILVTSADYDNVGVLQNNLSGNIVTLGTFGGKVSWDTQATNPWDIGVGDFDDDGKPDLLTSNNQGFNATVWPNNTTPGNITYAAQEAGKFHIDFPGIISDNQIIDLDSDGKLDIIHNNYNVAVWAVTRNNHINGNTLDATSFDTHQEFWVADDGFGPDIADLNKDGRADFVNGNYNLSILKISENTSVPGNVSFGTIFNYGMGVNYTSSKRITPDDLDNDGDIDLIVTYPSADRIYFLPNKGNATLTASSFFAAEEMLTVDAPTKVYTIDLNNDNWRDLIVISATQGIYIYMNKGLGGPLNESMFDLNYIHLPYTDGSTIYKAFDIADVNADGKPDFTLASIATNEIIIWQNNSDGINITANDFEEIRISTGSISSSMKISDIDLDGKPDFYFTDVNDGFSILRNKSGEFDLPIIAVYESTTFCSGDSVELFAPAADSYFWSTGEVTSSIFVDAAGDYDVVVTNSGVNDTLAPITITIASIFDVSINEPTNSEICIEGSIDVSTIGSVNDIVWSTGEYGNSTIVQNTGWYSIIATDLYGCSVTDSIFVTAIDSIQPQLSDTTSCGLAIDLNAENSGVAYLWSTSEVSQIITINSTGMYTVAMTNICGVVEDSAFVEIFEIPDVDFLVPQSICVSDTVDFIDSGSGNYNVEWFIDGVSVSTNSSFSHVFYNQGNYTIQIIGDNGNCLDSTSSIYSPSTDSGCEPPTSYCIPTGNTAGGDFIDGVQLESIINTGTGDATGPDYTYFNTMQTTLGVDYEYILIVTSGDYTANELAAWIDFNIDGDFDDPNEKLGEFHSSAAFSDHEFNFSVPSTASLGATRMRVRINWNTTDLSPCEPYSYGETEDYWVNIDEFVSLESLQSDLNLLVYPNPTNGVVNIIGASEVQSIICFDLLGNMMLTSESSTIDLTPLVSGNYFLRVTSSEGVSVHKVVKQGN